MEKCLDLSQLKVSLLLVLFPRPLDLPTSRSRESAKGARNACEASESERRKSLVDLHRLQKIEFNLHNVGAKTKFSWGVRNVSFYSRLK